MNEIVGTLYFVLAHDSNEDWANEAEADTYFLFNSLMVSFFVAVKTALTNSTDCSMLIIGLSKHSRWKCAMFLFLIWTKLIQGFMAESAT